MKRRSGVMLVEVLIALAIGSVVLTGGVVALRTITSAGQTLHTQHSRVEHQRNQSRFLQSLGRLATHVGADIGTDSSFHFNSFCDVAEGWRNRCGVYLRRGATANWEQAASFYVTTSAHDSIGVGRGPGALRYLVSAAQGGKWQSHWHDADRLPLGLEIVWAHDSTFIRFQSAYNVDR